MPTDRQAWDYETVTPAARARTPRHADDERADDFENRATPGGREEAFAADANASPPAARAKGKADKRHASPAVPLRRGHALTYALLFLFTFVLYLRPSELYPSPLTNSIAFLLGTATLAVFLFTQFALEGNLTARPREVSLVLVFCLLGLLSIPLAIAPGEAWATFSDTFIRCVLVFVVMANAVRTLPRLRGLLWLAIATGLVLSLGAVNDYRLGKLAVEGYRVGGVGEGMFGNPNDLALFFVTVIPAAVGLCLASRSLAVRAVYALAALLMAAGIVVTFSRSGFLGLSVALWLMAWKLGRRKRVLVVLGGLVCLALFFAVAPSNYTLRLLSIFVPGLDPVGSSDMRQQILLRSIWTALRNPLLGIGMGNFHIVSLKELVSHNSYTQVAAEMGLPALAVYVLFLWTPLKGLRRIEGETGEERKRSRYYHLSVGLQASLVGYMVSSFFASVAYVWYAYYVVGYALCLRRIYESEQAAKSSAGRQAAAESSGAAEDEDGAATHAHAAAW